MIQLTRQFALFKQTILNDTRSVGIQLLRFIFALVLGLIVYIAQSEASRWREIDGLYLFELIFALNLCFSAFAGLFLFLPIIKEEKEEDTLGMIMMTGISPFAYLFGKLGSRLFMFALMLAVQIPVIYFCITLGGIGVETILFSYLFLLIITFHLANIFLLGSLMSTSLFTGVIISGGISIIFCYVFNIILDGFDLLHSYGHPFQGLEFSLRYIFSSNPGSINQTITMIYLAYLIITGIIFFFLSVYYFDTLSAEQEELEIPEKFKGKKSSEQKAEEFNKKGISPFFRLLKSKRFGRYAIISKDFRFTAYGLLMYILQLIALFWIYDDMRSYYQSDLYRLCRELMPAYFFVSCGAVLISSNIVFSSEIKNQTLSSLLLLPQSHTKLFWQKTLGVIIVSAPSLLTFLSVFVLYLSNNNQILFSFYHRELELILFFVILIPGYFLNSYLSLVFQKYSFFLSIGITLGWFFLHIFLLNMIHFELSEAVIFMSISGVIVTIVSMKQAIKKLRRFGVTS